jgi:hypothetical protein
MLTHRRPPFLEQDASWAFYDMEQAECLRQVASDDPSDGYTAVQFHPDGLILGTGERACPFREGCGLSTGSSAGTLLLTRSLLSGGPLCSTLLHPSLALRTLTLSDREVADPDLGGQAAEERRHLRGPREAGAGPVLFREWLPPGLSLRGLHQAVGPAQAEELQVGFGGWAFWRAGGVLVGGVST